MGLIHPSTHGHPSSYQSPPPVLESIVSDEREKQSWAVPGSNKSKKNRILRESGFGHLDYKDAKEISPEELRTIITSFHAYHNMYSDIKDYCTGADKELKVVERWKQFTEDVIFKDSTDIPTEIFKDLYLHKKAMDFLRIKTSINDSKSMYLIGTFGGIVLMANENKTPNEIIENALNKRCIELYSQKLQSIRGGRHYTTHKGDSK